MTLAWLSANAAAAAEPTETLRNHYNDPFVRVTNAIAACPLPRGPFMTEREAQAEAHPRIERGTTCFMAGKCKEPNAYRYDARIAERAQAAVVDAVRETPALAKSSVWLTVQRRFVFAQGCVGDRRQIAQWEALLRAVPDVEYVSADFAVGSTAAQFQRVPYPVMPTGNAKLP
ncbi:MAG TPA: transporter [Casimicrobium huifangae]|nr:transporter [Casimicrobium huifangae]